MTVEKVVSNLVLFALGVVVAGVLFMSYWAWFITPIFTMRGITFWEALGLASFVSFVKRVDPNDKRSFQERLLTSLVIAMLLFLQGWLIHGMAYGF